jgi:large subunit ribosomal protein L9
MMTFRSDITPRPPRTATDPVRFNKRWGAAGAPNFQLHQRKGQRIMGRKNVQLLLLKTIEDLGIVGDIVKVKPGHARNYLLPQGLAEFPTPSRIEGLKAERARAEAELAHLRSVRAELLKRLAGVSVTLVRSCNAKGHLYGSVTQRDIADALIAKGYGVDTRNIRLSQAIRHVGPYEVPVQFDKDLRADIAVLVEPDQPLEERDEMEFDDEGNLIEKPEPGQEDRRGRHGRRGKPRREERIDKKTEEASGEKPAETTA